MKSLKFLSTLLFLLTVSTSIVGCAGSSVSGKNSSNSSASSKGFEALPSQNISGPAWLGVDFSKLTPEQILAVIQAAKYSTPFNYTLYNTPTPKSSIATTQSVTGPTGSSSSGNTTWKLGNETIDAVITEATSNLREKIIISVFLLGLAVFFYFTNRIIFAVACAALALVTLLYPLIAAGLALCAIILAIVTYRSDIIALVKGAQAIKSENVEDRKTETDTLRSYQSPQLSSLVSNLKKKITPERK